MNLSMFSVYDSKAKAFLPPFFMGNDNLAKRVFSDCANDEKHMFSKHPEDYNLFCLGTFEDTTGMVEVHAQAQNLGLASQFVEAYKDPIHRVKPGIREEA